MLSQVNQLVQHILKLKRAMAASPDAQANVAADLPEVPLRQEGLGSTSPGDTPVQEEEPNSCPVNVPQPNVGRGAVIKRLFAPCGACAAPQPVCPPPVVRKHARELTAPEPSALPPLLLRNYIRPMTMDCGRLSSPSPAPVDSQDTKLQAALDLVTSAQARLTHFANSADCSTDLSLPKPYSLPRTSPMMPLLDEAPVGSSPSPMDSENDLPLNSISMADLAPIDESKMTIIFRGSGPRKPGSAVKLLVSTPKQPRQRYGCSRNQRRRAAHAKAREDLVRELEESANNRFYEWLGSMDKSTDAEVADLLAGDPMDWPQPNNPDPVVPSSPGLSSPSHLYKSPLPPVDEEVNKYDIESDWMDSESDEADQSPSPHVPSPSSPFASAFRPIQPQAVCATGPAVSPVSPHVLRVEGQPSRDGQDLHAPRCERVEGHSHLFN